jgi:hypothetical protein
MRSLIERLRLTRSREARLVIEAESFASLTLRSGRTLTLFDRLSRAVTQNDRQVATFGSIHHVQIDAESTGEGSAWLVALHLAGSRVVAVGRTVDNSEASLAAVRVATITGTRVVGGHVDLPPADITNSRA